MQTKSSLNSVHKPFRLRPDTNTPFWALWGGGGGET